MLVLRSILQQGVDENAFDEVKKLMEQDDEIKKIMEGARAIKDFEKALSEDPDATIASSLFKNEIAQLNGLLEIKKLQILSIEFMKKLTELVDDPVEKGHPQALGDLFHSEPLYLLWRVENPEAKPYFFTQRDMCPTCDHVCGVAVMGKLIYLLLKSNSISIFINNNLFFISFIIFLIYKYIFYND